MSTSDTPPRRLIHQRRIECQGYLRGDGLWDIEGHLDDRKTHPVPLASEGRTVEPGQPYHAMWLRLTLDDELLIHAVNTGMNSVPTRECPGAQAAYQQLVGECLGPGFYRRAKRLLGKASGCTHLTELLLPIATTAFQTIPMGRALAAPRNAFDTESYNRATRQLGDTCHALRKDGPIAPFLGASTRLSGHTDPTEPD